MRMAKEREMRVDMEVEMEMAWDRSVPVRSQIPLAHRSRKHVRAPFAELRSRGNTPYFPPFANRSQESPFPFAEIPFAAPFASRSRRK